MANTITRQQLMDGSRHRVFGFYLQSDGSNETATSIYASSSFSTAVQGAWTNSKLVRLYYATNSAATSRIRVLWNAITPILLTPIPANYSGEMDFCAIGGLDNAATGTAGVDGQIMITTTGLASGDSIIIIGEIKQGGS